MVGDAPKPWFRLVALVDQGSMYPEVFEAYVDDIVHFLSHVAEPTKQKRLALVPWVLLKVCFVYFVVKIFLCMKR